MEWPYIAPVGDWTHDLPHTVASNTVNVSHALNHSATAADISQFIYIDMIQTINLYTHLSQ